MKLALPLFSLLLCCAGPAWAGPTIADGNYACLLDGKAIGETKLAGGKYWGLAKDGAFGEAKSYVTMDPDRIWWLKDDLGELTKAGYRPDKTEIRDGGKAFDITLLTPDQGKFVTVGCRANR